MATGLRHQEPVKGIAMKRRKFEHREGVIVLDGEGFRPDRPHAVRNVTSGVVWQLEPTEFHLDGYFPRAGRRKEEFVDWVLERVEVLAEPFRLGKQPKKDVGVEE